MKSEAFLMDCMEGMKNTPDNYYDLAVVDPPYGILSKAGDRLDKYGTAHRDWDKKIPSNDYFEELMRISKNQIIWGANYFPYLWAAGCKGFIFWYKRQPLENFAAGELAWTSFDKPAKCFDHTQFGGVNAEANRFHPTQKPIKLYDWIFAKYATPGMKILDTHLGSGSSRIAAYKAKLDFTGYEIDAEYFEAQEKRFQIFTAQGTIF